MNTILLEIVIVFSLLLANGVFALAEISVVSSRKGRLKMLADQGSPAAAKALALAMQPGPFLSTVQIGITLVGILAGAFGGATLSEQLVRAVAQVPVLAPYSRVIGLILVVGAITYASLIIGELVPKRIGLNNPEKKAMLVDGAMEVRDLRQRFSFGPLPGEADGGFETLGGFVLARLGHIPHAGEYFEWGGGRFEVMDMDRHRVDKMLLTVPSFTPSPQRRPARH